MEMKVKYNNVTIGIHSYPPPSVSPQFRLEPKPTGEPQPMYPPGTYDFAGEPGLKVKITAPKQIDTKGSVPTAKRFPTGLGFNLFNHWEGDATGKFPVIEITVDSNMEIIACYGVEAKPPPYEGGPTPIAPY